MIEDMEICKNCKDPYKSDYCSLGCEAWYLEILEEGEE